MTTRSAGRAVLLIVIVALVCAPAIVRAAGRFGQEAKVKQICGLTPNPASPLNRLAHACFAAPHAAAVPPTFTGTVAAVHVAARSIHLPPRATPRAPPSLS